MQHWRSTALPITHLWRVVLAIVCATVLATWTMPARADVWGYVDARGVAHFASEKLDDRYELFFRNAESFDTRLDPRRSRIFANKVLKIYPAAPQAGSGGSAAPPDRAGRAGTRRSTCRSP